LIGYRPAEHSDEIATATALNRQATARRDPLAAFLFLQGGVVMSDVNRAGQRTGNWLAPGTAVAAAVLREAEGWASTQGELVLGMETLWTDWMKRQSEALDAGSRSLQQMFACRNPADLVQIQQQWAADTLRRAASDISSLASDALAMTRRVSGSEPPAAGERGPMPRRGAEPAQSSEGIAPQRAAAE
jgi:phasin protein